MGETSQISESKGLTKLEWFNLVTGLINLVANFITFATLFSSVQATNIHLLPNFQITPFNFWIIGFFGISYTVMLVSYYARRILTRRYMRYRRRISTQGFSYKRKRATESAISSITYLVGIPLFLLHFVLLFQIVTNNLANIDSAHLDRLMGKSDTTDAIYYVGVLWVIIGPLMSYWMTIMMESAADSIYTALRK